MRAVVLALFLLVPVTAQAESVTGPSANRGPAFEVNALWPFYPGGLVDLKIVQPVVAKQTRSRGELIAGLHSDFGWRSVRDEDAGRVAFIGAKLGYRQFIASGFHVDSTLNMGWRHEVDNPWDGEPIHSFQGRLWTFTGYQHELTDRVYINARAGFGLHMFRTDRFADRERIAIPAGDLNVGFKF